MTRLTPVYNRFAGRLSARHWPATRLRTNEIRVYHKADSPLEETEDA